MEFCELVFQFVFINPRVIRPHRIATYVDAAYCFRPSSVVCRSVCGSVGRSITLVSPAQMAEAIGRCRLR